MKVLITGATGLIGSEALNQCLLHPDIDEVVAVTRRKLNPQQENDQKLRSIILENFETWPADILDVISDADAMIWYVNCPYSPQTKIWGISYQESGPNAKDIRALGSNDANKSSNLDYPLVFQNAFVKGMKPRTKDTRFRYIHVSGKFVEQDQNASLRFMPEARKIKGVMELETRRFADEHQAVWQTFITRPGPVLSKAVMGGGVLMAVLGKHWIIRDDQLGAFLAELAVKGDEDEEVIIQNQRMVERGAELLASR